MNVEKYLDRIGFTKKPDVSLKTLKEIHRKHLFNIAFENLDIHRNKKIILNERNISRKLLDDGRGGYCYELNGMFYLLLKKIGFDVKIISSRVNNGKGGWGAEFDHLALIVKLPEGQFLADVGFGDSFIEPLKLQMDKLLKDKTGWFKIIKFNNNYFKLTKSLNKKDFTDEYIFSLKRRKWNDFKGMNHFHQTSEESHFTKRKVCTLPVKNGRVTLSSDKLIITTDGRRKVIQVKNDNEFNKNLRKFFGIQLK